MRKINVHGSIFVFIIFGLCCNVAYSDGWYPDLRFQIEGGDFQDNMTWVSGFAYSRNSLYQRLGCIDDNEAIGSEELVRVLNQRFDGQDITSEGAAVALDRYLSGKYEKDCFR